MSRWHRGNPRVKAMDSVEQQGAIPDSAGSGGSLAPKALLLTSPPGRRQNSASRSGSEDLHTLNEIISPVTFNTPSPPYASHYDFYEVGGISQLGGATSAWEQPISWNLAQLVPPLPPGSPFLHLCHAGVPDSVSLQYETVSTSTLFPSSSVPPPAASYPPAASRPPLDREWVSDIRRRENERRQKNPCKLKRRAKRAGLTRRQSESEQQILGGNEGCIKLCHDEELNDCMIKAMDTVEEMQQERNKRQGWCSNATIGEVTSENEKMTTAVDALSRMVSEHSARFNRAVRCVSCQHNKKNVLLRPCNHLCMCSSCSVKLPKVSTAGGEPVSKCPVCRAVITEEITVDF